MGVEVFVLYGDGGVFYVVWKTIEFYWRAVFVLKDFVEKFPVSV